MLREELKDTDIPHRMTIRNRILQLLEYLDELEEEMKVRTQPSTRTEL